METASPTRAPGKARLVRFWSDSRQPYTDGHVRIEWVDARGVTRTSCGRYYIDDNCVAWDYEEPKSGRVYNDAIDCAGSAGDFTVVGHDGVIGFAGVETYEQMCERVEGACSECGAYVGINQLSTAGDCPKCFVARMGAAS